MMLCITCRWYVPDDWLLEPPSIPTIRHVRPNPRWAECDHPSSLQPAGKPSPVDGSIREAYRLRCVEARMSVNYPLKPDAELCGPDAEHWEPVQPPGFT
jgi:hypothetical protein